MPQTRIAQRNIRLQTRVNFLSGFVFLTPVITLLYTYTNLSLSQMVLLVNISSLSVFVFELPTSVFADTVGRKKSLVIAVLCNFLAALCIVFFPTYIGFGIASFFGGLYFAFWSGTGQAFLEENLRELGEEKKFGKNIGRLMAMETAAGILASFVVSGVLKWVGEQHGYTILACMDALFAGILVFITLQLKEINPIQKKLSSFKAVLWENYETAKIACKNVFCSKNLRIFLLYRSLANHVAFLFLVSLPLRVEGGMEPWLAGIFGIASEIAIILATTCAYKGGEKWGYTRVRVFSTIAQAILLILVGCFTKSWILITIVMVCFNFFEGLWMPSWNHVLVGQTKGVAIATTRSVIFGVFALYTTLGKWILSLFPVAYALIGLGIFMLLVNAILAKKMVKMEK